MLIDTLRRGLALIPDESSKGASRDFLLRVIISASDANELFIGTYWYREIKSSTFKVIAVGSSVSAFP